jgi:hypothetical protein
MIRATEEKAMKKATAITCVFLDIAEDLGIRTILCTDDMSTCTTLASFGLQNDEGLIHENS